MAKKSFNFDQETKEPQLTAAIIKRNPAEIKAKKLESLKINISEDIREFPLEISQISSDFNQIMGEIHFFSHVFQYSYLAIGNRLIKIREEKIYPDKTKTFDEWLEGAEIGFSKRMAFNYIGVAEVFGEEILKRGEDYEISKLQELYPLGRKNPELIPELLKATKEKSLREIQKYAKEKKMANSFAHKEEGKNFVQSTAQTKLSQEEEKEKKIYSLAYSLIKKGYKVEKMKKILSLFDETNDA